MTMLMKEFAKSLGQHNIRVNAMLPGAVAAGGLRRTRVAKHIPMGRIGSADDLAHGARGAIQQNGRLCDGHQPRRRRWIVVMQLV